MTGPWSCPCLGPARGTQSTGQVVESAIGGFALQVIAGRRHHGASCPISGIAARCDALTWAGQSSLRPGQRRAARSGVPLVLADGRLSQPFLLGRSPTALVSRTRRQSSLRRTVATDNVPGDRARFREIGQG
jgi:hypothetical protein